MYLEDEQNVQISHLVKKALEGIEWRPKMSLLIIFQSAKELFASVPDCLFAYLIGHRKNER